MAYVLRSEKQLAVLHMLVEGNSIRSVERVTGVHRDTIIRLLVRAGHDCRRLLDRRMQDLRLEHIQIDEQWTFVGVKNARIPVEDRRLRYEVADQYLFLAIDEDTKLIPAFLIGKRTGENARRFLTDLSARLAWQLPHDTEAHGFRRPIIEPLTWISSDQWAGYPEAIDLAFGGRMRYGQLHKDFRNRQQPGSYAPAEMVASDRRVVFGDFDARSICTSRV